MSTFPKSKTDRVRPRLKAAFTAMLAMGGVPMARPARAATITTLYTFSDLRRRAPQDPSSNVTVFRGAIYGKLADGKIYKFSPQHDKVQVVFQGANTEYVSEGALVALDGALYGYAISNDDATNSVFKIDPATHTGSIIYTFPNNVVYPGSNLAALNGKLYGTLLEAGKGGAVGTLFSLDPATATFTVVHTQTAAEGNRPYGGLTAYGGLLFGATSSDGPNQGTVFQFDPTTSQEVTLHTFTANGTVPGNPYFGVVVHGDDVFGFTDDFQTDEVWLYRVSIKTGGAKLLQDFNFQTTGEFPNQSVVHGWYGRWRATVRPDPFPWRVVRHDRRPRRANWRHSVQADAVNCGCLLV